MNTNSRSVEGMIFLMHGRLFVFYGMSRRSTANQSGWVQGLCNQRCFFIHPPIHPLIHLWLDDTLFALVIYCWCVGTLVSHRVKGKTLQHSIPLDGLVDSYLEVDHDRGHALQ